MTPPATSLSEARPRAETRSGFARLGAVPLWARLITLTAAGLISLIGSSMFFSSALHQTADRTTKMKELFDVVGTAGEAHVTFGKLRYWLTDLSVSLLVTSERSAIAAREKLEANLDRLAGYDPETVTEIRSEVEAYFSTAMDAADAYTDGNRVIGNTFLASARGHSEKVDDALNGLVEKVSAAAFAERQFVVENADQSARAAVYIVVILSVIGIVLTFLVFRSIVHPLHRLNDAIAGLMQGNFDVEIPPEGDDEFGAMARTLRLFRENAAERSRLEEESERQRNTISTAVETISDGFVLYDRDARVLLANSKYREMFSDIASVIQPGTSFRDIMAAQVETDPAIAGSLPAEQWIEERVARHRDPQDTVDERRYGDLWMRISKRQTPDGGKVAVYTDITEMKEREAEIIGTRDAAEAALADLQKAQKRLVQAEKMASLGQLTAGIAHEIKNPLNFVNNFAKLSDELLEELAEILAEPIKALDKDSREDAEDLLATARENLVKINEHGKRADSIVKNMLLHSREGPSERRTTGLNAIAEEALNLAYHGARAEDSSFNIEMIRSMAEDAGDIECYPQDLMRVFLNLMSNGMYAASKRTANADAGYAPTIWVTTRSVGNGVEIEVRDNGGGIPPDVREKIFLPFFTTKPAGEGTGLGLSLSYDIVVKQHGGELALESEPGEFTIFRVKLPRILPPMEPQNAPSRQSAAEGGLQ
ncbi:MAG TPA: ATP-binding protein [Afifellaceae bacterium]|nr:ATP-binding protein [Afifellaceae bacterium]